MSIKATDMGWEISSNATITGRHPVNYVYWVAPTAPAGSRCLVHDADSNVVTDLYSVGSNNLLAPFPVKKFVTDLYTHTMAYGYLLVVNPPHGNPEWRW